jgi:hypothetical protein
MSVSIGEFPIIGVQIRLHATGSGLNMSMERQLCSAVDAAVV